MIKRLLALDGVMVVVRFRDDGQFVEGYGLLDAQNMQRLARFAHDYKRFTQGNADQFSMFTRLPGWTPPRGVDRARAQPLRLLHRQRGLPGGQRRGLAQPGHA